ncbi:MAG: hypothetical protein Q4F60_00410 [Candidatus Saccharibacteria bacterium]|nr:hypothetical protein [Candidatus Saccharibacteria bacterium]
MRVNLVSCVFVLDSEKNDNIRKNEIKRLKVLVDKKDELPEIIAQQGDLKKQVREQLADIIGTDFFHLEQVYAMDYRDEIDIIYLGITNIEYVDELKQNYKLVDFEVKNNSLIILNNKEYKYQTLEIEENNNIEYIHEIATEDSEINRVIMSLLISYKRIRNSIDNTDTIFKFMGSSFTLEDVRMVYELIKDRSVDKSNFRKRIVKYCEKVGEPINTKSGYRPSQRYKFKPLKGDIWI